MWILSHLVEQLIILLNRMDGFHGGLVQKPAENEYPDGNPDLPCERHSWMPPDQGQRQRSHSEERDDNGGCPEIPGDLFFFYARNRGCIQKLAAVFALYRFVLNLFGAEGTLFHYCLSWQNAPVSPAL
jgi:hypothetical protein